MKHFDILQLETAHDHAKRLAAVIGVLQYEIDSLIDINTCVSFASIST